MKNTGPIVRHRQEHNVSRKNIDPDALRVLYRLQSRGFKAYLVGGGVRDLLLGRAPKDFDVATDAHPNQIRSLFRNCFLIGRRFRLAHIKFGPKIVETSTFRREPEHAEEEHDPATGSAGPHVHHHENTFGTPETDAFRRDFTVNALFYDVSDFSVIDYVGGLADVEARVVRCIGDPDVRLPEDPVRMLRAVRFAARLDFDIEPVTYAAIRRHAALIGLAAPARLIEELARLFAYRSGAKAVQRLHDSGLLAVLLPEWAAYVERSGGAESPLWGLLRGLDELEDAASQPDPTAIFATLLWGPLAEKLAEEEGRGSGTHPADLARELLAPVAARLHMPKRVFFGVMAMTDAQRRMESDRWPRRYPRSRFARGEIFPAALELLAIRVRAGMARPEVLAEWRRIEKECGGPRPRRGPEADRHPAGPRADAGGDEAHGSRRRRGGRRGRGRRVASPSPAAVPAGRDESRKKPASGVTAKPGFLHRVSRSIRRRLKF